MINVLDLLDKYLFLGAIGTKGVPNIHTDKMSLQL